MSVLQHGCTALILTTHLEKKQGRNYKRIYHFALNKFGKQNATKQQLYVNLTPISQTNKDEQNMLGKAGEVRTNS